MQKIYGNLELIARILVAFGTICYVLGLIVLNAYFSQFGFFSYNLLRINYVFAGIWCLIVVGVVGFQAELFFFLLSQIKTTKGLAWKILLTIADVMIWGFCAYSFYHIGSLIHIEFNNHWSELLLSSLLMYIAVGVKVRQIVRTEMINLQFLLNEAVGLSISILLVTGYLLGFGRLIYQTIPAHVGGGKPLHVQVVFDKEMKESIADTDIIRKDINRIDTNTVDKAKTDKNSPISFLLLSQIDDNFMFRSELDSLNRIIVIRKSAVKLMLYKE